MVDVVGIKEVMVEEEDLEEEDGWWSSGVRSRRMVAVVGVKDVVDEEEASKREGWLVEKEAEEWQL